MPIREGIEMSEEDAQLYDSLEQQADYYDRLQYIYKIKLNSFYGAVSNQYFRFFDLRIGESTTGTGRLILRHQCRKVNELLGGEYDTMFPLYGTVEEAVESGSTPDLALNGPVFNGKYPSDAIVYGDSVVGSSLITTSNGTFPIEELFKEVHVEDITSGKQYYHPTNVETACYDEIDGAVVYRPIKYIMRHAVNKQVFRVTDSLGNSVDVTEDHSMLVVKRNKKHYWKLEEVSPKELTKMDTRHENWFIVLNPPSKSCVDFSFSSVVSVEPIDYKDYVYDIEVAEHHNFFANNILVHNTDSTYFRTYAEDIDEAVKVADWIGDRVNKSFPAFMRDMFLCNDGYDNLVKCAREVVSSNGIFVQKKRYILNIVDKEGVRKNFLKIMGLDTKKTTLPKNIANRLNDFVGRYLKGEDWSVISKEIVEFKDELQQPSNIIQIGLPKGVTKVELYTKEYEMHKEKARLPGHVAASIFYNMQRNLHNDTESPLITSGMKIKVFYLKNPQGKFKSIALPGDITNPPPWFSDFPIDMDMHIERLIDNPLNNIIKAINKQTPSRQTLLEDDLLVF